MATIEEPVYLDFCDVLIRPKRSGLPSRDIPHENLSRVFKSRWHIEPLEAGIPIIASNMDHTGTIQMAHAMAGLECHTALHKHHTAEQINWQINNLEFCSKRTWLTIGMDSSFLEEIDIPSPFLLCVDVANGYQERFCDHIKELRAKYPQAWIMAGNVATYGATEQLILSGADVVKIGIGPGSVCTTRKVAGVGVPQLSAIMECVDAAHGLNGLICADGGCVYPADVAKAFGAGADFVMLGGMLAGHNECAGSIIENDGRQVMKFYGMSSSEALAKYAGGTKHYRAPEGKVVYVNYKGAVEDTIELILGGVKSAMTYTGAWRLKDLSRCTTFIRVNRQLNNSME